ncbi:hypothetical protein [Streptomyces sp. NPDC059452]|uniref:hypothetical protein n=1 Tax=Streptomyces sp. NPDC059452 TaxID=3346835 RepID=UPI0036C0BBE9
MVVFTFVLAGLVVAMGCIKADRVRSWRRALNPSAPELPDAAFTVGRIVLFGMAGLCLYSAFQFMAVTANAEWSDEELASAVSQSVAEMNGMSGFGNLDGSEDDFDDENSRMIKDELIENGGGGAPQSGVAATPSEANKPSRASYTVTAYGASAAFCVQVERVRDKDDAQVIPGGLGREGSGGLPRHTYTVKHHKGEC